MGWGWWIEHTAKDAAGGVNYAECIYSACQHCCSERTINQVAKPHPGTLGHESILIHQDSFDAYRSPNGHLNQFCVFRQFYLAKSKIKPNSLLNVSPSFFLGVASGRAPGKFRAYGGVATSLGVKLQDDSERHTYIVRVDGDDRPRRGLPLFPQRINKQGTPRGHGHILLVAH